MLFLKAAIFPLTFQTLLVYDLLKKKYIKKQTGLYIIPCPNNEYRILEGGLLLGLAENRYVPSMSCECSAMQGGHPS